MKAIKNFSKFAIDGDSVVNKETGKVKSFKTNTNKYQLFDDNGKSHTLTFEQIKALVKPEEKTPKTKTLAVDKGLGKTGTAKPQKEATKKEQILDLYKEGKTPVEIEAATGIKANTAFVVIKIHRIMSLHAKGKTPQEISEKTGYKVASVEWQIEKSGGRG